MEMLNILHELSGYYSATRQAGHTTLMKRGTSNFEQKKLVLVINQTHGKDLGLKKDEIITLNSIERLRGHNLPLAIDNAVFMEMSMKVYSDIKEYEEQRNLYRRLADGYQEDIKYMRAHPFKTLFKTLWRR